MACRMASVFHLGQLYGTHFTLSQAIPAIDATRMVYRLAVDIDTHRFAAVLATMATHTFRLVDLYSKQSPTAHETQQRTNGADGVAP